MKLACNKKRVVTYLQDVYIWVTQTAMQKYN